jgi:hypothetical protein
MVVAVWRLWNHHADDENLPELVRIGKSHYPLSIDVLHALF